jgi:prepilin-type N-terminal cleavage/methylation domain-containing protein
VKNFRFSIFDSRLVRSPRRDGGVCQKSKIRAAFSLVEVLVALTIFALSAVILGSAYVNVLNAYAVAGRFARTNEDVVFARSLVMTQPDITKLQDGGEFDGSGGRRVKWSAEITPTTTADLFTVVFTCEVAEATGTQADKTVQTFMLLRPTWSIRRRAVSCGRMRRRASTKSKASPPAPGGRPRDETPHNQGPMSHDRICQRESPTLGSLVIPPRSARWIYAPRNHPLACAGGADARGDEHVCVFDGRDLGPQRRCASL